MNQQKQHSDTLRQAAIREGIKMERQRVTAMLLSPEWRNKPCDDVAMLIANGMHWEER